MNLTEILSPNFVNLNLKAGTKQLALEEMIELLASNGIVTSKDGFLIDVLEREAQGPTGIGNAIAIPHGKSAHVSSVALAIGRTSNELAWETLDDSPVKVIIMFAVPKADQQDTHLKLLARVAGALASEEACHTLLTSKDTNEIIQMLEKE